MADEHSYGGRWWFLRDIHRESGEVAMFVVGIIIVLAGCLGYWGFLLVSSGSTGVWAIQAEFTGFKLYVASVAPGLFVILAGVFVAVYGPYKALWTLQEGYKPRITPNCGIAPNAQEGP